MVIKYYMYRKISYLRYTIHTFRRCISIFKNIQMTENNLFNLVLFYIQHARHLCTQIFISVALFIGSRLKRHEIKREEEANKSSHNTFLCDFLSFFRLLIDFNIFEKEKINYDETNVSFIPALFMNQ
jgi:hypothetical protein